MGGITAEEIHQQNPDIPKKAIETAISNLSKASQITVGPDKKVKWID